MSSNKKNGIQKIKIKENINKNNDKTHHPLKNESNTIKDLNFENNIKLNLNFKSFQENKKVNLILVYKIILFYLRIVQSKLKISNIK